MGAELGILSGFTHQQKLKKSQPNSNHYLPNLPGGGSWMWNPMQAQEDDDSWEVRAFAEDTGNIMGATWPPRSYICTFCRREFRSAQALGGHMNVHRRDRARLHQTQPPSPSTFIISNQDLPANAEVCLLYQLPNPNGGFAPTSVNAFDHSSTTLLSISPYPDQSKLLGKSLNFLATSPQVSSPQLHSSKPDIKADIVAAIDNSKSNGNSSSSSNKRKDLGNEELDLELRLGHRSRKPTSKSGKLKLMTV